MSSQLKSLMRVHPLFSQFDDAHLDELASSALSRSFVPGAFVSYSGDVWPYLLLVESGCLTVIKESSEGRQLVALTLGEGAVFWGLAFFQDELATPAAVLAVAHSTVHLWTRDLLLLAMMEKPEALWMLCQYMVLRMNQASQIVENFAFKPMASRLAVLLLGLFSESGENSLKRTLTLDELAARVGSTREEVCRALYHFANRNLIEITRTEFSLVDKDGLARMGEP